MSVKFRNIVKVFSDFPTVSRKQELSGTINSTDATDKTILVYDRDNGDLIATTVRKDGDQFKLYLPPRQDEHYTVLCRDEGGNFNADIYDRLSLCTVNYDQTTGQLAAIYDPELLNRKIYIAYSENFVGYDFNDFMQDIKKTVNNFILSIPFEFRDASSQPVDTAIKAGTKINDNIQLVGKNKEYLIGNPLQSFSFFIDPDFFGDSSALTEFLFLGGDVQNLSGTDSLMGAPLFTKRGDDTYTSLDKETISRTYSVNLNFLETQDYSISFFLYAYGNNGNSYLPLIYNIGGIFIEMYYTFDRFYFRRATSSTAWSARTYCNVGSYANSWIHVVFTYSATGELEIFVDKVSQGSFSIGAITGGGGYDSTLIGSEYTYEAYFNIKLFRVFTKLLTQTEIDSLYDENATIALITPPCLLTEATPYENTKADFRYNSYDDKRFLFNLFSAYTMSDDTGKCRISKDDIIYVPGTGVEFNGVSTLNKSANSITSHGNESSLAVYVNFSAHYVLSPFVLWKSGNESDGLAVGSDGSSIGVFSASSGVLQSIVISINNLIPGDEYHMIFTPTRIYLYDKYGVVVKTKVGNITFYDSPVDSVESMGGAKSGSPITLTAGDCDYFIGTLKQIKTFDNTDFTILPDNFYKMAVEIDNTGVQCLVDLETYDPLNKQVDLWATVPNLSSTVDNELRLFFDRYNKDNKRFINYTELAPALPGGASQDWQDLRTAMEADTVCAYSVDNAIQPGMIEFAIPNSLIDEDLSDFPVPIYLGKESGKNKFDTDFLFGYDWVNFKFLDEDGNQLYAEIEQWEDTSIVADALRTVSVSSHWTFDNVIGSSILDETGNCNLTNNGMTIGAGKFNNSANNAGITTFLETSDTDGIPFKTICLWFRRNIYDGYFSYIITSESGSALALGYTAPYTMVIGGTGTDFTVGDTNWHFLALREGTEVGKYDIYFDGVWNSLELTFDVDGIIRYFGKGNQDNNYHVPVCFDNIQVYTEKLTDDEVSDLYNATDQDFTISVSGEVWKPTDSIVWFDADAETELADSASVSTLFDLSGNGNDAINTGTSAIYKTNALNGKPVYRFSPPANYDLGYIETTPGFTYFIVKSRDTLVSQAILARDAGSYQFLDYNAWYVGPGNLLFDRAIDTPQIFVGQLDPTAGRRWLDGTQLGSTAGFPDTAGSHYEFKYFGGYQSAGNLDGDVAELLIYDYAVNDVDRQKIEGYLAHKWGLEANLPIGHPYRDNSPSATTQVWEPSNTSMMVWLDASDDNTVTMDLGVSVLADKSVNSLDVSQGTASYQPTRLVENVINGVQAIHFDGADQILSNLSMPLTGTPLTVFAVAKWDGSIDGDYLYEYGGLYSDRAQYNISIDVGDVCSYYQRATVIKSTQVFSTSPILFMQSFIENTPFYRLFANGQELSTDITLTSKTLDVTVGNLHIGQTGDSGFPHQFAGNFGELIIMEGEISDEDRQKIEGYLAHKWGLEADLPVDHPYKVYAPGASNIVDLEFISYAKWDASTDPDGGFIISPDGVDLTCTTGVNSIRSDVSVNSGKWYWECTIVNEVSNTGIGIATDQNDHDVSVGRDTNGSSWAVEEFDGAKWYNNVKTAGYFTSAPHTNDIISVALDMDNGEVYFALNGVWGDSGDPITRVNPAYTGIVGNIFAAIGCYNATAEYSFNFGVTTFSFDVPTGFNPGLGVMGSVLTKDKIQGNGILHVKVPSILSSKSSKFYLEYDGTEDQSSHIGIIGSTPAQNVWDTNFEAVYHMKFEFEVSTVYDSTVNGRDLTQLNGQLFYTQGGTYFSGNSDLKCTGFNLLDIDDITIELKAKFIYPLSTYVGIFAASNNDFSLAYYNTGSVTYGNQSISYAEWQRYLLTNTTGIEGYISITQYGLQTSDSFNAPTELYVMGDYTNEKEAPVNSDAIVDFMVGNLASGNYQFLGNIYEIRISSVKRSREWRELTELALEDNILFVKEYLPTNLNTPLLSWEEGNSVNVTIPASEVPSDMTDFPVLISLKESSGSNSFDCSNFFSNMMKDFNLESTEYEFYDFENLGACGLSSTGPAFYDLSYRKNVPFEGDIESRWTLLDVNRPQLMHKFTVFVDVIISSNSPINTYMGIFGSFYSKELTLRHYNEQIQLCFGSNSNTTLPGPNQGYDNPSKLIFLVDIDNQYYEIYDKDGKLYSSGSMTYLNSMSSYDFLIGNENNYNDFQGTINQLAVYQGFADENLRNKFLKNELIHNVYTGDYVSYVAMEENLTFSTYKGVTLTNIVSMVKNLNDLVSFMVTTDNQTFQIYTTSWIEVVSKDDSVHGNIGDSNWYYKDYSGLWVLSGSNINDAVISAVKAGYLMFDLGELTSVELGQIFDSSVGLFGYAVVMYAKDSMYPPYVDYVLVNGKDSFVTDETVLSYLDGVISNSKVSWDISEIDISQYGYVKVYAMLSNGSAWVECTNDSAIPVITPAMATDGLTLRFKVEWDATVLTNLNEKNVIIEITIN